MRYFARLAPVAFALIIPLVVWAQNSPAEPRFEVVSIKPHTGPPLTSVPPSSPGALRRPNVTVLALVLYAFQVDAYQVIDLPPWGRADRFDVEAKAEGTTAADMPAMTRTLLRERFGLQAHHEMRDGTTYSLVLANGRPGPNLKQNADDCKTMVKAPPNVPAGAITTTGCGRSDQLARLVTRTLNGPVADKTGLGGFWEYALFYSPEGTALAAATDTVDTIAPHLTTALQEQLGLKVESSRGPVDVLVIDHIERPTEN